MADPTPLARITALNAKLMVWRHAYYVANNPIVSDDIYNAAEQELKALAEANPTLAPLATVLTSVGSDLTSIEGAIKHSQPMLSLDNAFTDEDLDKFLEVIPQDAMLTLEPKIDGLSLSLRYRDHHLWLATTRGDGTKGEDVTAAALRIPDVPHTIDKVLFPPDPEVRGEVFLTRQQFAQINEELKAAGKAEKDLYKTSRNLASGTLKMKDPETIAKRRLSFQPWQVIGIPYPKVFVPETPEQAKASGPMLVPEGLQPAQALEYWAQYTRTRQAQIVRVYRREDLKEAIENTWRLLDTLWADIIGDCDGLVLKVYEGHIREELGVGTKSPRWALALKKQQTLAITRLIDIEWTVGRSGVITPTGVVEPVVLGGATVQRASLCNMTHIRSLGLKLGAPVEILRSGEVIPKIVRCLA